MFTLSRGRSTSLPDQEAFWQETDIFLKTRADCPRSLSEIDFAARRINNLARLDRL